MEKPNTSRIDRLEEAVRYLAEAIELGEWAEVEKNVEQILAPTKS